MKYNCKFLYLIVNESRYSILDLGQHIKINN